MTKLLLKKLSGSLLGVLLVETSRRVIRYLWGLNKSLVKPRLLLNGDTTPIDTILVLYGVLRRHDGRRGMSRLVCGRCWRWRRSWRRLGIPWKLRSLTCRQTVLPSLQRLVNSKDNLSANKRYEIFVRSRNSIGYQVIVRKWTSADKGGGRDENCGLGIREGPNTPGTPVLLPRPNCKG